MKSDYSHDVQGWAVLDTFPMSIGVLDEQGTIIYTNRAWHEFGEQNAISMAPDTLGVNYLEVSEGADDEYARQATAKLRDVLTGNSEVVSLEYPCHSPTTRRWFLMRATPFVHDDDRYVTVAHFDITDRVLAEEKADQRREEVVAEREQLALLNQILRHDIRNDVNIVQLSGELLSERIQPPGEEHLDRILNAATHVQELIDAIGGFTTQIQQSETSLTSSNLSKVVADAVEKVEATYEGRPTNVRITGVETFPSKVSVRATPLLSSVFSNLLNNAVLHNDKSTVEINVSIDTRDDTVVVRLSDNGPGVPDEKKRTLFGRREKGSESPGSGMGLYLVDKLVESYDGSVWIEDNQPEGAVFCVELPRR
ncbi:ATP-binding protein [Salinigranum sp. GCM10025319]|uniref:sensor histidine kinase n=1 Tax=Salinigranum sp. GCM10025319 TaxID=3252687 RepID=UPI003615E919